MAVEPRYVKEKTRELPPEGLYRYDNKAQVFGSADDLTEEHFRFYEEFGYLAVERLLDPEEVESALAGLKDLIAGANPDFTGLHFESWAPDDVESLDPEKKQDYLRKFSRYTEYDARLMAIAEHPKLIDVVSRIVGGEPTMFQDMALIKPPRQGREKPWHQDKAYFTLSPQAPVVGAWIALDPATPENGCMHVIPGSHREGPVIHFQRRDWQICDTNVDVGRDTMVPLPPGGCLFFDGLIHHGTPPNNSGSRRRALQLHYKLKDAAEISKEERLAIYGSEGKDVEC